MSSRGRSSSSFNHRRPSSPFSSASSTSSSFMNGGLVPRSTSSSASSFTDSHVGGLRSRSVTPSRRTESMYGNGSIGTPVPFTSADELSVELVETGRPGDTISVTIRFRPLSDREYNKGDEVAWYADGDKIVRNEYGPETAYGFDRVFGPSTVTQDVYEVAARPIVKAAMEGVSGTVFAYGVTSSGKTHTMHGDHNSPGVIPLAIKDVFSIIQDTPGREFLLRVSYLEIYNEVINDLLDPTGQNLRVREDLQGTYVEGIKEEVVLSPGHTLSFIAAGEEHRHVGSNNFNLFSSRSHTIFTLMIESSDNGDEDDGVIYSQLNLIDLAGSESSKTETTGLRRKEGSYINKSLLTLGTVIGKLSEGKATHVPYRDSKLTRLLQSSLSGHGHVSLICTITPASSNMEESHNTLKFASRAKRVEICASRNKIIDEKSLIKKYQREISSLKEELDQLKRGMVGFNHEEILTLKQKLEEGQVKMQSRLEEEEEAKAALMSRIQRLTKLILVSSKNTIPGYVNDMQNHQRSHSIGEDDKLLGQREVSLLGDNDRESASSVVPSDPSYNQRHGRSSSKWNGELSPTSSTVTELTQAGELISASKLHPGAISMSDQMDLFVEQVKILAGEIAFSTSTLKRMVDQSANDPDSAKIQIQNLEREIEEKRNQMQLLEQRIVESGEASIANASMVDMQQTIMRLMTQCNENNFELEVSTCGNFKKFWISNLHGRIKSYSRIIDLLTSYSLCSENKELQEKLNCLQQQQTCKVGDKSVSNDYVEELMKKIQNQENENEQLRLEHVQLFEDNIGLHVQNKKLAEEASYAKELASAAAVELKNLANEVTKLSIQNSKLEKELLNAREMAHSRVGGNTQPPNGFHRWSSEGMKPARKGRFSGRANNISMTASEDFEAFNHVRDDLKIEMQARKHREAALETALAEKEFVEKEYRKKAEEAKKKEEALENDLANMWVLVAKLKKEGGTVPVLKNDERQANDVKVDIDLKTNNIKNNDFVIKERQVVEVPKPARDIPKEEPLVTRLKARMQEMKEKELKYKSNGDSNNSHVCKVCFESSTAAVLLPCRHFCLCENCSLACTECPVCRTKISDRLVAFNS